MPPSILSEAESPRLVTPSDPPLREVGEGEGDREVEGPRRWGVFYPSEARQQSELELIIYDKEETFTTGRLSIGVDRGPVACPTARGGLSYLLAP